MEPMPTALAMLAAFAAVPATVAIGRASRNRRIGVLDLVLGVTVATLCLGFGARAMAVVAGWNYEGFIRVHAVYLGIVIALPAVAVGLLVLGSRRPDERRPRVRAVVPCVALALLAPLGWYMSHIEPNWLRVDALDVPVVSDRAGDGTVRVAVLADLQTASVGDHERGAVRAINDGEPDLIVIPGDLYQPPPDRLEQELPGVRELLGELEAPHGVYFVQGDHEGMELARRLLDGTGITLLDDEVVEIPVRDRTVLLGGTSIDYASPSADEVRARLQAEPADGAITVLLSHRPDTVLSLPPDSRVDLTVAGHTHGGQVVLPGFGPPITLTGVPRDAARGGLHRVDGNPLYVSPGVGVERGQSPQLRLFNRPAVTLLELGG